METLTKEMGEQKQTQSQYQYPPASSQAKLSLPIPGSISAPHPQPQPIPGTDATPESDSNSSASMKTSNPSKIPIRPQKIRKLSSAPNSAVPTSQSADVPDEKILQLTDSSQVSTSYGSPTTTFSSSSTAAVASITCSSVTASNPKNRRRSAHSTRVVPQFIKALSAAGEIESALHHLRSVDPLLATVIDSFPPPSFESNQSPFLSLAKSILYQQLAYKAGASIYNRFVSLCGGESEVRPEIVLALSAQQLKQVGVSGRKASYLYDLAHKYISGILSDDKVVKMDDRSLFTMLSMVKGIGSWSVHMFMIFSLHRPDVLPVSDLGVRKGVQLLYGLEELPRPSQMEQLCEKWKPYRSVGAWYMWRLVEGNGAGQNADVPAPLGIGGVQPLQQIEPQQDLLQQQHQLHLLEPINGLENFGPCVWGQ